MCIRDSPTLLNLALLAQSANAAAAIDAARRRPAMRIQPTPVSYTHLRAHETVLDLVCRLLLEKKKKKVTNMHANAAVLT